MAFAGVPGVFKLLLGHAQHESNAHVSTCTALSVLLLGCCNAPCTRALISGCLQKPLYHPRQSDSRPCKHKLSMLCYICTGHYLCVATGSLPLGSNLMPRAKTLDGLGVSIHIRHYGHLYCKELFLSRQFISTLFLQHRLTPNQ